MSQDLKNRLERWVDRGEPTGALALLERVERDLEGLDAFPAADDVGRAAIWWRPGWTAAAAAAVIAVLVLGLVPWLLWADGGDVTQPTSPVTAPQTTVIMPDALEPSALPIFDLKPIPAFSGVISLEWGNLNIVYAGGRSGLRVDLVDASQSSGYFRGPFGELGEGGPGSSLVVGVSGGELTLQREGVAVARPGKMPGDFDMLDWRFPTGGLGDLCARMQHTATGVENVAGRWAHVLDCEGLGQSFRIWVDAETGLILRLRNGPLAAEVNPVLGDFEFNVLDYNPTIPADTFFDGEFDDPVPATQEELDRDDPLTIAEYESYISTSSGELFNASEVLTRGEEVPPLTGQYLDGTPFDLESLRGRPVLIHFWSPHINQLRWGSGWTSHTDLVALDWATMEWGDSLHYVSIARGDSELAAAIADEFEFVVPAVLPADPHPWDLMNEIWPAWVLVDEEGLAVAAFQNIYPADAAVAALVSRLAQDLPAPASQ